MNNARIVIVLATSFLVSNALAHQTSSEILPSCCTWVASFSFGPTWNGQGQNQTFFLAPEIKKKYISTRKINSFIDGEVFFGIQGLQCNAYQTQVGIAVAGTGNAEFSGNICDDGNPRFNNYTYKYLIRHTHVALKGKFLVETDYCVIPWLSASIGIGWNRSSDFSNIPTIFEAIPNNNFTSNTYKSFTYTLGVGIQQIISANWQLGIGYEFSDWGNSQLGRAAGQTMGTGLKQNHLYNNSVLVNITYLA